jgi:hypothetical protein
MQPYDLKELVSRLQGRGLGVAEEAARAVLEEVFGWTEDSIRLSATPFDDVALVVLPKLKELALQAINKIDGKVEL